MFMGCIAAICVVQAPAALGTPHGPNSGVPDRSFEIAFFRGAYPAATALVATTGDGRAERSLVRPGTRLFDFAWARRGTSVYVVRDEEPQRVELQPDGSLQATADVATACFSSPEPARDGTRLTCPEGSDEFPDIYVEVP